MLNAVSTKIKLVIFILAKLVNKAISMSREYMTSYLLMKKTVNLRIHLDDCVVIKLYNIEISVGNFKLTLKLAASPYFAYTHFKKQLNIHDHII